MFCLQGEQFVPILYLLCLLGRVERGFSVLLFINELGSQLLLLILSTVWMYLILHNRSH